MQIFELSDPAMKKDIWDHMSIYTVLLFEKAYNVWVANEKSTKNSALWNTFIGRMYLDLTHEPLLRHAFCQLPLEMQQVMRNYIPIIERVDSSSGRDINEVPF